jgi:hypothetical protein
MNHAIREKAFLKAQQQKNYSDCNMNCTQQNNRTNNATNIKLLTTTKLPNTNKNKTTFSNSNKMHSQKLPVTKEPIRKHDSKKTTTTPLT